MLTHVRWSPIISFCILNLFFAGSELIGPLRLIDEHDEVICTVKRVKSLHVQVLLLETFHLYLLHVLLCCTLNEVFADWSEIFH